jgi:CxxC motif-containing protein
MGCALTVKEENGAVSVTGNLCARGKRYGEQELLAPMRTVTASVKVVGGDLPLLSVKTNGTVPKSSITQVLRSIGQAQVTAPVQIGNVVIKNVADTGVDVTATRNIIQV